jgi:hypothetical protein
MARKKKQNKTYDHLGDTSTWPIWALGWLAAFSQNGNATNACEVVGIARSTAYFLADRDKVFAAAWAEAKEEAADRIELEIHRRAVDGVLEPVFYQGVKVSSIRKYSDPLLALLAGATRPAKFRTRIDNTITGANGGPVQTMPVAFDPAQLDRLDDAELAALESIIGKLNAQPDPSAA